MKRHALISVSLLKTLAAFLGVALGASAADRPNVLLIAIDDFNQSVGVLGGHPKAHTPNIDRLAERGVLFTNAHCAAPGCNPSRTAVLTGLLPTTTDVYVNGDDWRSIAGVRDALTLPEAFRLQGYRALGAGKIYHAHSIRPDGFAGHHDPTAWDAYFPSRNRQLPHELTPETFPANKNPNYYNGFFDWAPLDVDDDAMGDGQVVRWAAEQLAKTHEQPLFLAVGIYRPHIPWYTPKSYFDNYPSDKVTLPQGGNEDLKDLPEAGRDMTRQGWHQWIKDNDHWTDAVQAYLASATFADAMVGRLLAAFDASPLRDNTVIVLWSDHGYHLGHKEHWEKFALWEQTTRVPLIIAGPDIPQGARCQTPVSLVDLYPTLTEICKLERLRGSTAKVLYPFSKTLRPPQTVWLSPLTVATITPFAANTGATSVTPTAPRNSTIIVRILKSATILPRIRSINRSSRNTWHTYQRPRRRPARTAPRRSGCRAVGDRFPQRRSTARSLRPRRVPGHPYIT